MTMDCSDLKNIVHLLPLVEECDVVRSGALRMSTPFVYPNGSHVDVFLEKRPLLYESYLLSDCGQTGLYLQDAQVKMDSTERKRQILGDICAEHGIALRNGCLELELSGQDAVNIATAIFNLSQTCVRIADFGIHQRLRSPNPFRDDVEEFLEASGLRCKADVRVPGLYGRDVKVDFEVEHSYILVLAAINETAAHSSANEINRKWHDLASHKTALRKFVTVYNSSSSAIRADDLQYLSESSELVSYPEQEDILVGVIRGTQTTMENSRIQ